MAETPAKPPPARSADAAVESPTLVPGAAPLCFVVDEEPTMRHFLSLVLHGAGVDTMEFPDGAALRKASASRAPALIFHNVSLESADAIESVIKLGVNHYGGAVQLMSNRGGAVLEHVKSIGEQHKLNMLPVLKKPFETEVIIKLLNSLKLGMPTPTALRFELNEVLKNNWLEFWYQPRIDLRRRQLAGAEAYARARHPQHGVVLPDAFLPGATEAATTKLAEKALVSAIKAGLDFLTLGINLRVSVNIPVPVLVKLPIEDIIKANRPNNEKWAGLTIDVPESQIISELALASELARKLERINVQLAMDECGRGHEALARFGDVPFAEMKLDRSFVVDCGASRVNAPLCKTVIDLAHAFGRVAVGMGIEKAPDAVALVSMGCDFGQGFLLGQPMPEQRFISLLRQRAATQGHRLTGTS